MSTNTKSTFERARERVDGSPQLRRYREIILDDLDTGDAHWRWVATAPVKEIVEWAEGIERQLADAR